MRRGIAALARIYFAAGARLRRKLQSTKVSPLDAAEAVLDEAGKVVWSYALGLNGRPATPGHDGHGDHTSPEPSVI